jgi:hypothetical protein
VPGWRTSTSTGSPSAWICCEAQGMPVAACCNNVNTRHNTLSSSAWIDLLRSAACTARHGTAVAARLVRVESIRRTGQRCVGVWHSIGFVVCVCWRCNCLSTLNSTCSAVAAARTAPTRSCVRAASCCCRSRRHAACTCPLSGELLSQCLVLGAGGAPYASTLQLRSRCSCSTKQARNVSTQRLR